VSLPFTRKPYPPSTHLRRGPHFFCEGCGQAANLERDPPGALVDDAHGETWHRVCHRAVKGFDLPPTPTRGRLLTFPE